MIALGYWKDFGIEHKTWIRKKKFHLLIFSLEIYQREGHLSASLKKYTYVYTCILVYIFVHTYIFLYTTIYWCVSILDRNEIPFQPD